MAPFAIIQFNSITIRLYQAEDESENICANEALVLE